MVLDMRAMVFPLCIGLLMACSAGCASRASSDMGSSLQPPSNPAAGRSLAPVRAGGAETALSARVAQATPVVGDPTAPLPRQEQGAAFVQAPVLPATQPSSGEGREGPPPSTQRQGLLPPTAPGHPERLPPSPLLSPDLPQITLEQLIQIAFDNQPRIRSSQASLEGAEARVGTARSAYFPRIDASAGYNRQTANVAGGVNPSSGIVSPRRVSGTSVNRQDFTAQLRQNVFDSFRREWNIQAARENQNAAQFDLSTTREDIILGVQEAYYNYLLARRLVEVNAEAVRRNIQSLERARGFFEVGTRPKIDVTRAQVDLANAELALVRARNAVALNFAALNNAIGVPEFPPYSVSSELEIPAIEIKPEEFMSALEENIKTAIEHRSEIRAFRARIRSAEASLTLAKRNFLPSIDAAANWNYRGQELPYAPNWTVGAVLNIPVLNPAVIFSGR